jgi:hypothetical protein
MSDSVTRRDALKALGAAGAGAMLSGPAASPVAPSSSLEDILPLTSTSDVFVPPRGRAFNKFSFDFPEPSVAYEGLRLSVIVFTRENAYALDPTRMRAERTPGGMRITAEGLTWAGGQERAPGRVVVDLRTSDGLTEWDIDASAEHPIKAVATILRGVPRGRLSMSGGDFFDPRDDEILYGYPFSGGDLFGPGGAGGLTTTLAMVERAPNDYFFISSLDDRVRTKRFFFQPGESGYRVEATWEVEGWKTERRVKVPTWRAGRATSTDAILGQHYAHVARAFRLPAWETRRDVPAWLRDIALVTTLHGQHYTGYIFNDYAKSLETLRWMATQIPAARVLVFLSAWDGRYYWDYPEYRVSERMGGDAGFRRLIGEGQRLGFKMMPMFGANTANRRRPMYPRIADASTAKIDGDTMDLNWVDWDNDRHQDGWLAYMNLGVDSWRRWMTERIADCIQKYGVDAYFLDIAGGWTNNPQADMHEGMRRLVADLRTRFPRVLAVGEMHYDALLEILPLYHAGGGGLGGPYIQRHAKFFQHLSLPAPGRGSSGVHEAGFGRFDPQTLALAPHQIPTLNVVDDTFAAHRDLMAAVIAKAKERAGI